MNQMSSNQLPTGLDRYLKSNYLKIELVVSLIFLTGILMKYYNLFSSSIMIMLSLGLLGILYFLGGLFIPDAKETSIFRIIGYRILHISWSVSVIGLAFIIQKLPGAQTMVNIGTASLGISLLAVIAISLNNWTNRVTQAIIRSLIICLLLYFINY